MTTPQPRTLTPARSGYGSALSRSPQSSSGVPAHYNDGAEWLVEGAFRHTPAAILGLLFGWSGIWLALWAAALGALAGPLLVLGILPGYIGALFHIAGGEVVSVFTLGSGVAFGIAYGFLATVMVLFVYHLIQTVVAMGVGVAFAAGIVLFTAAFERLSLRMRGYRRLSQDEARRIASLVKRVADEMGLPALPRFAMADIPGLPNAWTHMRTVVLTSGLLQMLDDEELEAILAHELHHWRAGDSVGLHVVWACSWPIAMILNLGVRMSQRAAPWMAAASPESTATRARGFLSFLGWALAWPAWMITRFVMIPATAASQRRYEYQADHAAAAIGLARQLISALTKISAFEGGRTGWEASMARTHPPTALRIEALQPAQADDEEYQEEELRASWSDALRMLWALLDTEPGGPRYTPTAAGRYPHNYGYGYPPGEPDPSASPWSRPPGGSGSAPAAASGQPQPPRPPTWEADNGGWLPPKAPSQ